jgi:hypothetical protein
MYFLQGKETIPTDNVDDMQKCFAQKRHVALDKIGESLVSTVFLPFDHSHGDEELPLLFETMIFGGEHDQSQWRYTTYEEAERGHERAINLVKGISDVDNLEG